MLYVVSLREKFTAKVEANSFFQAILIKVHTLVDFAVVASRKLWVSFVFKGKLKKSRRGVTIELGGEECR